MIIRLEHLAGVEGFNTRPGFCRSGARTWFKRHGLDWSGFRHDGIESDVLLKVGDAFALALVAHARKVGAGRGQ